MSGEGRKGINANIILQIKVKYGNWGEREIEWKEKKDHERHDINCQGKGMEKEGIVKIGNKQG